MINIFSPINNLGYGIFGINILKALMDSGEDTCLLPIGQPQLDPFFESYVRQSINNRLSFNIKNLGLFLFHDEYSIQACGNNLKTLSMFETTILKQISISSLENGPTTTVLTTTQKHKELLKANGITKPIEILHGGVDDSIFNTVPIDKLIDTGKFTFITCGKNEERKNTNQIIKAFINASNGKECALICHTFNPFLNKTQENPLINLSCWTGINPTNYGFTYVTADENQRFHKFSKDKVDIYFTFPGIPYVMLPSLYHSANVGIQCSRAEGWDLPLNELLGCGKHTITTDCIGHSEFILDNEFPESHKKLIINITEEEIANDGIWFDGSLGTWGKINQEAIEEKINYVLDNTSLFLTSSEDIASVIENKYTWTKSIAGIYTN